MKAAAETTRKTLALSIMLGLFTLSTLSVWGQTSLKISNQEALYTEYEYEHFASKAGIKNVNTIDNVTKFNSVYSNHSNSLNSLNALLVVEMEDDIELENWMLEPFEITNEMPKASLELNELILADKEEEIALEDWMINLNAW